MLVLGDIFILYISLFVTLLARYGVETYQNALALHLAPFSFIFFVWIAVFYIVGLYDLRRLANNITFLSFFSIALLLNGLITTALFYLIPWFGIAPRTNLSLFLILFALLEIGWRRLFWSYLKHHHDLFNVVIVGGDSTICELAETLTKNPQLGYRIVAQFPSLEQLEELPNRIGEHQTDVVVVPRGATYHTQLQKVLYSLLASGTTIYDVPAFYEEIFRKIPLRDVEESWFLEHISIRRNIYDDFKRALEVVVAGVIGILLLPLVVFISLFIRLSSSGPVIFRQERVGIRNHHFTLYKFRTMVQDAEKDGARWASKNDPRTTFIGKILRYTHLDELPQIWNIIRGDLSFVGPRPERPEFVSLIEKEVPYYNIRHLIKPGVTGWAQINYRYGSSIQDSEQKLQYDLYYLKNRSLILDVAVILKTLRTLFVNET